MEKNVVIATHKMLYGASQALRDYLLDKKIEKLLFIAHPLVDQRTSSFYLYLRGKLIKKKIINRSYLFGLLEYSIDFFWTIWWVVVLKERYKLFVGVDPLNCLAGLLLRFFRRVDKVVFYSIDFSPVRFRNKLLNFIFHKIEVFCVMQADHIWNVSPRIAEGREKFLGVPQNKFIQKVVPIGVWNKDIKKRDFKDIKKHQLLFAGHLLEKQGVQLVLDSVPNIIKKIPDFKFVIVGGGEYKNVLKEKIKKLRIEKYVSMTGWIREREELDSMMSESACAIAVYKPEKEKIYNFTYYADPTKIKDYLGAGLPVILTDVSYNAKEIDKRKCGVVVKYSRIEIEKAIFSLMLDERRLIDFRRNALSYAKEFCWEKIFTKALKL